MRVADLLERLSRLIVNDGHHGGLKPVQWEVLRYLARANRFSRTPSALTAYLGSTKGTVSQSVIALERKGWVAKKRGGEDKRSVTLELTAAGREKLGEDPLEALELAVADLGLDRAAALEESLAILLQHRLAATGGKPFGLCASCRFFRPRHAAGGPHFCDLLRVPLSAGDAELLCVEQES